MTNGALVLAGGGVAGIAWEAGVLLGIQDVRPATARRILDQPTTLIGTSAGATVAAFLAAGRPIDELYQRQFDADSGEVFVEADFEAFVANMTAARSGATSPEDERRRIGRLAKTTPTVAPAVRHDVIVGRLSGLEWTERDLRITAVNADTGVPTELRRDSGVTLVQAVEASSAVPGIWPVVTLKGEPHMDGGVRSMANADLAVGSDPVLILMPQLERTAAGPAISADELDSLSPSRVHVVYADDVAIESFGSNPLDPGVRPAAALAGRSWGQKKAAGVAAFWDR